MWLGRRKLSVRLLQMPLLELLLHLQLHLSQTLPKVLHIRMILFNQLECLQVDQLNYAWKILNSSAIYSSYTMMEY